MSQEMRERFREFRKRIKEESEFAKELTAELDDLVEGFLDDDPKARKNTALLLGELPWTEEQKTLVLNHLYGAYEKEAVLYVRSSYLKAMSNLKVTLPISIHNGLEKRLDYLLQSDITIEEKKHIKEEQRELFILLDQGERGHEFKGIQKKVPLLLTTAKGHENYLISELKRLGAVPEDLRKTPFGVRVMTEDLSPILRSRIYDKIYFIVPIKRDTKLLLTNSKETLESSMLAKMLTMYLAGDGPIPFRVKVSLEKEEKDQTRLAAEQFSKDIEELFEGKLFNSPGNYEIELFFAQRSDQSFGLYLWFREFKNERFLYRNTKVATSMAPTKAAVMMEMAYPYLKEGGFSLDPFCGTGTLLIERQFIKKPKESFGVDTFGEAILDAREASEKAKTSINFIHRNYFDFTFDGDFDEIITEFPDLFHKEKEEKIRFFQNFFEASLKLTKSGAMWMVLTSETHMMKQEIRLTKEVRLKEEIPFGKRRSLFLLERL